ncbi:glycosyltransferase family 4 protein [Methanobacterium sp.]|uniref:glycosyltransferase family 4 protein n=1 Tax=Methanobacterium sp. TaxID=2164 RepID=UPI003C739556
MAEYQKDNQKICIVTYPFLDRYLGGPIVLNRYIKLLSIFSRDLMVITGNNEVNNCNNIKIRVYHFNYKPTRSKLYFIFQNILAEFKSVILLIYGRSNYKTAVFLGGEPVLTLFTARLLKKNVILFPQTSVSRGVKNLYKRKYFGFLAYLVYKFLERINIYLANWIIIDSEEISKDLNLERSSHKVFINNPTFIETSTFKINKNFSERKNLIGYIGRLSEEKGILNFLDSIPLILKRLDDVKIVIGGSGPLKKDVIDFINQNGYRDKIQFVDLIPHEKLPGYLNELKLVVIPSYIEGLPTVMLESMACGTLILATPVGGVPSIIEDNLTGFIMKNNSPECICENVIRSLSFSEHEKIIKRSLEIIEDNYSLKIVINRFKGLWVNI